MSFILIIYSLNSIITLLFKTYFNFLQTYYFILLKVDPYSNLPLNPYYPYSFPYLRPFLLPFLILPYHPYHQYQVNLEEAYCLNLNQSQRIPQVIKLLFRLVLLLSFHDFQFFYEVHQLFNSNDRIFKPCKAQQSPSIQISMKVLKLHQQEHIHNKYKDRQ